MSDFTDIESCHSEGGDYFHCAIQEAKNGGAIAYVVHTEDLEGVNLDAPEIFEDSSRGIKGITPLSRVRIRHFENDDIQLGLPELRTYGERIPGFKEQLKKWTHTALEDTLKGERPKMSDFELRGGSYKDNSTSLLFNDFFGDKADKGDLISKDGDDVDESLDDQRKEEIEDFDRRFNDFENPVQGWYYENDEGHPITFSWQGRIRFSFPRKNWDENKTREMNWKEKSAIKRSFNSQIDNDVDELSFENERDNIIVECTIEDGSGENDPDGYRSFLETLKDDYDDKYWELYSLMRKTLIDHECLMPDAKDKMIEKINSEKYKNFFFSEHPYGNNDKNIFLGSAVIPLVSTRELYIATKGTVPVIPKNDEEETDKPYWNTKPRFDQNITQKFNISNIEKNKKIVATVKAKVKQWWEKAKAAYHAQPTLVPRPQFPSFQKVMDRTVDPELFFSWSNPSYNHHEQTLNMEIRFDIDWDTDDLTIYKVLKTIHLLDNNMSRLIEEVRYTLINQAKSEL